MDVEEKQAEHIDFFVKQASSLSGPALANVVAEATSHPSLFAFSEILAVPNVLELEDTDSSIFLDLLRIFAHGTWSEYKSEARRLPQLVPDQVLKLKQLTVLTMAETKKVLPYDILMKELDVSNVRELEDFLINDCMYVVSFCFLFACNYLTLDATSLMRGTCNRQQFFLWGIVRGKLDQLRRCFEVQFAAGRDLRPGQLGSIIQTLDNWLTTSDNLLASIQEKIKWADTMSEMDKKHKKEVDERVEETKKSLTSKRLQTPIRPTWTSEGMKRSFLNMVE